MKVKIGDQVFDSSEQPIMVIFNEGEKELIANMHPSDIKFCSYPDGYHVSDVESFMAADDDQLSLLVEDNTLKVPVLT